MLTGRTWRTLRRLADGWYRGWCDPWQPCYVRSGWHSVPWRRLDLWSARHRTGSKDLSRSSNRETITATSSTMLAFWRYLIRPRCAHPPAHTHPCMYIPKHTMQIMLYVILLIFSSAWFLTFIPLMVLYMSYSIPLYSIEDASSVM